MARQRRTPRPAESGGERRRFTLEFKREAVALCQRRQAEGRSINAIARDLGVLPDTLRYWRDQTTRVGQPARGVAAQETRALQLEVKRLQKELQRVEEERDFLKRAAAFFAKESP